jgi:hypothetical protein
MKLAEIIDRPVPPPVIVRRPRRLVELTAPRTSGRTAIPDQFESALLAYLVVHREPLGISQLLYAENLLVDGGVLLEDGRFLAFEIKYRMNWLKACQTGWQFGQFVRLAETVQRRPVGGLVFFEEFSGDWARPLGHSERGWANWYAGHAMLPGDDSFRIDLIRFREGRLETAEHQPS